MSTLVQAEAPLSSTAAHVDIWHPKINPWWIAGTVMISTFMEVLDTSIANVALPHIAGSLSAGVDESTWVLTSYLVANAIVLPLTGWFSKLFGRKRFYITCVFVFIVSSFLCGVAPSLPLLVLFRILQGAGGGGLQPVSQAILVESFPREKQGMAMAIYGMGVVVAPIIGPTLGGWITDNYSWRWIFFINVPVGLLSIFLTMALISDPPHLPRRKKGEPFDIDYIGLGLLSVGLGFLQVVLDKGQRDDWFSSSFILWSAIVTVAALVGAVLWELNRKNPIVELHLFKDRNFATATFTMFSLGIVLYGSTVLLPVMLQTLNGYTAQLSGLVLSPGAIVTLISLPLVGALLGKFQARTMVIVGLLILAAGMYSLSRLNLETDFWTFVVTWMISRGGLGFLFVPINVAAFAFLPKERMNNATGLINLARNIGGSVGISMVTTMQSRLAQKHQYDLVGNLSPINPRYQAALHQLTVALHLRGTDMADATRQATAILYGGMERQASMLAFIDVYWIMSMVCLGMIPLMLLIRKSAPHKPGPGAGAH